MSDPVCQDSALLLLGDERRIGEICDAFDAEWRKWRKWPEETPQPRLENHLAEMSGPVKSELLRALLRVELEYRCKASEPPSLEEYCTRLPDYAVLIADVFENPPLPRSGTSFGRPLEELIVDIFEKDAPPAPPGPTPAEGPQPVGEGARGRPASPAQPPTVTLPPLGLGGGGAGLPQGGQHAEPLPVILGYNILSVLQQGGMGVVHTARHLALKRVVAIKMIKAQRASDERFRKRFQEEARELARLEHPNIVRIHDYQDDPQGPLWFSMEYVPGGSLHDKLAETPLSPEQAAELVEVLARAMDKVHRRGIIHRDLKPANVLLTADGSPKIADFQSLPTGTVSSKVAAGDLNRDGIPDLVVGDYFNNDVVVLTGRGDGTFQDAGSVLVDGPPTSVVIGDLNDDGIPDLATANQTDLSVSVLLGNGDGTFKEPPIRTGIPTLPFDLVAAYLNHDGVLDLVATSTTSNDVTVLLGQGDGTFQVKGSFTVGFGNSGVVAADLNGDGIPDLATSNFLSHDISVLLGDGKGNFNAATTIDLGPNTLPSGVVVADFNGDGTPDLAASDFTTSDVSVLLGRGDGTFRDPVRWGVGPNPNDIVAADFNGDGIVDLATPNFGTNDVSVLLGQGDGTFRDVGKRFGVGTTPYGLIAADLNGDGRPDLAAVNVVSRDVSVLTGLGDGTFLGQEQSAVATSPSVVVSADFNLDGIPDLAAADFGSSDVAVLLGRGDGTFQNQVRFPTDVNPLSVTVGDFNGDGFPDLATANVSSYSVPSGSPTTRSRSPSPSTSPRAGAG
jgi:tRNA A-37 threonylcarbamoyl transferase component Bud32